MSTCISSHGEYSEHTPDDTHACTRCAVLDEDALIAEIERLRAELVAITADAEGYRKASLTLKRQRDQVLALLDDAECTPPVHLANMIRATFARTIGESSVDTRPPACYRVGGKQPRNLYRIDDNEDTYIGVCFNPNDTAHIVDALNTQPAPTNTQTWEQGDGGGVPDDGTEHAKPEPEKAWRDHNGKIWVLSSGKLHLAGWQHGIEPIDLDNMTPLVELPPDDKPQFVYCQHCPSMAKLIVGLIYRCPLCLNETTEPVDTPPLASGGVVHRPKALDVGDDHIRPIKESLAALASMTAIAQARIDVIAKAKAWVAVVHAAPSPPRIWADNHDLELIASVDVLARAEDDKAVDSNA